MDLTSNQAPRDTGRILFVDDEQPILNSLMRLTRKQNFQCLFASSGAEALEIMQEQTVDLVVSDMRMPEMSGHEFLAEVKQRYPGTIRYLLTGQSDLESTVSALNDGGISRFIHKPWDDDKFIEALEEGLKVVRLERDNRRLMITTQEQALSLKRLNAELEDRVLARTKLLRRAMRQLETSYDAFVKTFSYFISHRAHLIKGQSQLVADLCFRVCDLLQVESTERKHIFYAALLHEVGKLALPDEVLGRSEVRLTGRDREEYRQYPVIGELALTSIKALEKAALLIRHQNEHFDGSGYPDRLVSQSIPLGSRILLACREFIGIQTEYMRATPLNAEEALNHLRKNAGIRYDPAVVEAIAQTQYTLNVSSLSPMERIVSYRDLAPGMILNRDLVTDRGILLISRGGILTQTMVDRLRRLGAEDNLKMPIHIIEPALEANP
ncbi:response regulator [Marinobacter sp. MA]|uniref:HD domain-containing phosphohydrolase n=1 Tax=Marinobacter sp. MA TaxID=2971606 RepID=UPI003AAFD48D